LTEKTKEKPAQKKEREDWMVWSLPSGALSRGDLIGKKKVGLNVNGTLEREFRHKKSNLNPKTSLTSEQRRNLKGAIL